MLLLPNLNIGGAEKVNIELARQFKYFGFDVCFVLGEKRGLLLNEVEKDIPVYDVNRNNPISTVLGIKNKIDTIKPDYVIASMWGLTVYTAFAKVICNVKFKLLLVEHSSLINQFSNKSLVLQLWLKISTFFAYRISDHLAGVSSGVCKDMQNLAYLKSTPEVLYNPIPIADSNCEQSNFTASRKHIITAGRLIDAKDQDTLIRAFAKLKQSDYQLTILGDGPLMDPLQKLAIKLGVIDNICFAGFVDNPRQYFLEADLFVLSSIREGLPTVLIEALGTGTPVVSTDCMYGPQEILKNDEFGILVPVGDAKALAVAMELSLSKNHDKKKLINRARDFAPEISAKRYLEVLGLEKS